MNPPVAYQPPAVSAMEALQDEPDGLRLLLAQRRLYNRAKRWLGLRWLGMAVIGIAAPVVSVFNPDLAVAASAIAGGWIFLSRTWLLSRQTSLTLQAACVQELFDQRVFGMPQSILRAETPSFEAIAVVSGPESDLGKAATKENLPGWYTFVGDDPAVAVAIAQRSNASYSNSLLKTTGTVWTVVVVVWAIALIGISVATNLTLAEFLLGIFFPVLPAMLDVGQYTVGVRRSAGEKRDLAREIESHVSDSQNPPQPEDLLVWQESLFAVRRSAPEVPNVIYKLHWKRNEEAMSTAARQLGDLSKGGDTK